MIGPNANSAQVLWGNYSGNASLQLAAGASRRVVFMLDAKSLSLIDHDGNRRLEPGAFRVFVGGSQPDSRSLALLGQAPLSADLSLTGMPLSLPY